MNVLSMGVLQQSRLIPRPNFEVKLGSIPEGQNTYIEKWIRTTTTSLCIYTLHSGDVKPVCVCVFTLSTTLYVTVIPHLFLLDWCVLHD